MVTKPIGKIKIKPPEYELTCTQTFGWRGRIVKQHVKQNAILENEVSYENHIRFIHRMSDVIFYQFSSRFHCASRMTN